TPTSHVSLPSTMPLPQSPQADLLNVHPPAPVVQPSVPLSKGGKLEQVAPFRFDPSQFSFGSSMPLPQVIWQFAQDVAVCSPPPTSHCSVGALPVPSPQVPQPVVLNSQPFAPLAGLHASAPSGLAPLVQVLQVCPGDKADPSHHSFGSSMPLP